MYKSSNVSEQFSFVNSLDLKIACYKWDAEKPKAVVVGFHGIKCHGRFDYLRLPKGDYEDSWVSRFNDANMIFYTMDHIGHGESESWQNVRCNTPNFEQIVADAVQYVKLIHERHPEIPVFVTGNSMGGNVCAQVAQQNLDFVMGYIPMAAMLSIDHIRKIPRNRIMLPIGRLLSHFFPHLEVGTLIEETPFPWIGDCMFIDPQCDQKALRARMALVCLNAVDTVQANAEKITGHLLCVHSKNDTLCEPEGAVKLVDRAKNAASKKLVTIEKGWHVLTQEETHEKETFQIVLDWIETILRNEETSKPHPLKTE